MAARSVKAKSKTHPAGGKAPPSRAVTAWAFTYARGAATPKLRPGRPASLSVG